MAERSLHVLLVLAGSTGGIGRHVRTLAEELPARGVAVTVCAPASTVAALDLVSTGCRIVTTPLDAGSPVGSRQVRRTLRRESARVDIVHAHGVRAGTLAAAFSRQAPLIVTWHNAARGGRLTRLAHGAATRYVARSAALTLAASDDLAAQAIRAGAGSVRSVFVAAPELARPQRTAAELRAELGAARRPLVLAVARLAPQKRLDVLIAAAAAWTGPDAPMVVIAGEGPLHGELADQIAATGAPVTLLGARSDVADLLAGADVLALTSEWEARALVVQEAMRAGVPVVMTPVGGLPELAGDAAATVAVGDVAGLRRTIEAVLGDPARRNRMKRSGERQAQRWPSLDQRLTEMIQIYRDLDNRSRLS